MSDAPRFAVGDEVIDSDADEPGEMIVLDPDRGRADETYIEALEATVADVNPDYPPDDRVVECIHEEWLVHNAGKVWQGWPRDEFPQRLREYAREWSLTPRTYDYPEDRLELVEPAEPEPAPQLADEGEHTQSSMDQWLG